MYFRGFPTRFVPLGPVRAAGSQNRCVKNTSWIFPSGAAAASRLSAAYPQTRNARIVCADRDLLHEFTGFAKRDRYPDTAA